MRTQREGTWILFKNNRKTQETHSDYAGSITINGQEFWLNGWVKEGQNGKFIGGTIKAKQPPKEKPKVVGGRDFDDNLDF